MDSLQYPLASVLPITIRTEGKPDGDHSMTLKGRKTTNPDALCLVSQAKWCRVKAILPESQTDGRWVRGYLRWITGILSEIVRDRLTLNSLFLGRSIVRLTHQCYVTAKGRTGHLPTTQLINT